MRSDDLPRIAELARTLATIVPRPLSMSYHRLSSALLYDPKFVRRLEADPEAMADLAEVERLAVRFMELHRFSNAGRRASATYDITEAQFWGVVFSQDLACAICRRQFEPGGIHTAVDHNHETGAVRGVLCQTCNAGLGMFRDSPDILDAALAYLEERGCYGTDSTPEEAS